MYITNHISIHFNADILSIQEPQHFLFDSWQFLTLQKGSITLLYEDNKEKIILFEGDVLLISPNRSFSCAPFSTNTLLHISIDSSYLSGLLGPKESFFCDSTKNKKKNHKQLHLILTRLCSAFYTADNEYLILSYIFQLTDCLKKDFIETQLSVENRDSEVQFLRMKSIEQYIMTYYHQPISLDLLADKMFLTPQYLSKFIKKHLGHTFSYYLTSIRLQHAHTELLHTNFSITAVALNNGFPNVSAFNKAFREHYEISPSSYRLQHKTQEMEVSPSLDLPIETLINNISPVIEEINTSLEVPTSYQKPWCDTINIGSLIHALKVSFQDTFLEYQSYLSIKYVRFSDIFSEEIVYLDERTNQFNFTTLDEILDFFYHANIAPFIELSNKPRRTHLKETILHCWDTAFPPQKEDDYCYNLLSAILKHCIQRYGLQYMKQWRFELWLKHEDRLRYPSSFDLYFEKYKHYYSIIKQHLPAFTMGGSGFNICANIQYFGNFLDEALKHCITFDFISVYGFCYEIQSFSESDKKDNRGIISTNPNHISDTFLRYKTMILNTPYRNTPIFITELGSSIALENYVVDSVFQASFLCHTMLQLLSHCNTVAYLSFWDNGTDIAIPSSIYYPAPSLVSDTGIPKPALYAYSFLARLGKNLISQGHNYIMTCNSSNRFQLLFYNYTHFNEVFCFNPWDRIPMEHTYEIFQQEENATLRFNCTHFPPGRYKVVQHSLNRNYGSALDKNLRTLNNSNTTSKELVSTFLNLKEDESRYFKQTVMPRQDIYYINVEDTLSLDIILEPHEVIFYEFSRVL